MDLNFFAVIGCDDVIHGLYVAAGVDPDCLARGNLHSRNSLRLWTDVVGADFPKGIHHLRVAVQTEDLFLSSANREFVSLLNVLGVD
jgi:hypothetical protein